MSISKAGFFRELRHGDPLGPSLEESKGKLAPEKRQPASLYLRGGSVLATTGIPLDDWFDGTRAIAIQELRTDGEWVWPADYAHYVEKYAVDIPVEFLDLMAKRNWFAPELSPEKLLETEEQFFQQDE